MAKRRSGTRKSSKCPEPFNTLIDIAAGLTMGAVANHMEKKYRYTAKGKINPYAVSAFGLASGRMKTTEDIIRTGAFLGAMGSFDVEPDNPTHWRRYVPDDPVLSQIRETKTNNNRYAWRLNCEDGSEFGISPYDYETRDAYNRALDNARGGKPVEKVEVLKPEPSETENPLRNSPLLCCRVSRLDNGSNEYYLTDDETIKVGDMITVSTDSGTSEGIVIRVKKLSEMKPDELPDESMWILTQEDDNGTI